MKKLSFRVNLLSKALVDAFCQFAIKVVTEEHEENCAFCRYPHQQEKKCCIDDILSSRELLLSESNNEARGEKFLDIEKKIFRKLYCK